MAKLFAQFDVDNNGSIDAEECGLFLRQMGESCSDEAVRIFMKEVDKDGDGTSDPFDASGTFP